MVLSVIFGFMGLKTSVIRIGHNRGFEDPKITSDIAKTGTLLINRWQIVMMM
jgi:hypothetical protein